MEEKAATAFRNAITFKNLKRTYIKPFKGLAENIAASKELGAITATKKVLRFERNNKILRKEGAQLRAEIGEIRNLHSGAGYTALGRSSRTME